MARLKRGAVTVDLKAGGIYGDIDHCTREDLLESAEALLSLLPQIGHKGLWGLHKDYCAGCWLFTAAARYNLPKDLDMGSDIGPFHLEVARSDYENYWKFTWYFKLVGSVRDRKVNPDTEGVPDRHRVPQFVSAEPKKPEQPQQLRLEW